MNYGRLLIAANGQDSIFRGNREQGSSSGTGDIPNAIHSPSFRGIDFYAGTGGTLLFYDGIRGDGASMNGLHTELYQGSHSMGKGTAIRGTVEAWQASTALEASAGFHVSLSGN